MNNYMQEVKNEIKKTIKGKDSVIQKVLCAMLAGGHILLEDVPGVGKTTLAVSLSKTMSLSYNRVQFTPDVLPSDIVGYTLFNPETRVFEFQKGTIACNLFLADEINRTSPKTQSALLEVMEEGRYTVDGISYELPKPFMVIATQNPFGSAGTQRLPESQLDRFMIRLSMGYPNHEAAIEILRTDRSSEALRNVLTLQKLQELQEQVNQIYVDDAIYEYIISLSEATRNSEYIQLGLSPRGSKALLRMAKAEAFLSGRSFVAVDDVRSNMKCVMEHRLVLSARTKAKEIELTKILRDIADQVKAPKL